MRSSCIQHPENEPIIVANEWHIEVCDGDHCAALILGYFQLIHIGLMPPRHFTDALTVCNGILQFFARGSVVTSLSLLTEKQLICSYTFTPEEAKSICCEKYPASIDPKGFDLLCEWCNSTTIALQQHHYPIPRRLGGDRTVAICGSCHAEFHHLADSIFYEPTDKLITAVEQNPFSEEEIARISGGSR